MWLDAEYFLLFSWMLINYFQIPITWWYCGHVTSVEAELPGGASPLAQWFRAQSFQRRVSRVCVQTLLDALFSNVVLGHTHKNVLVHSPLWLTNRVIMSSLWHPRGMKKRPMLWVWMSINSVWYPARFLCCDSLSELGAVVFTPLPVRETNSQFIQGACSLCLNHRGDTE